MKLRITKWSNILLCGALLLPMTGSARQQGVAPNGQPTNKHGATASAKKDANRGGTNEDIKVHGAWIITVRNADGTVASHHEFKNALQAGAGPFLATVLARGAAVGRWLVLLNGPGCFDPSGNPSPNCFVTEPGFSLIGFPTFGSPTLSVSAPQSGPDAGMFVLSGSARSANAADIVSVETRLAACPATNSPASPCAAGTEQRFTLKSLVGIPVVAGQTIDVMVKISFS